MAIKQKLGDYIEKWHIKGSEWTGNHKLEVLGVSNTDGITKTSHIKSKDLSNYLVIEPNTFAYNPYRINVGSIGLTPNEVYGLVSPAYVVFKVKEGKLIPELLLDYLKSFIGLQQINKYAKGTVRKALRYKELCEIEIDFPSFEKQEEFYIKQKELDKKNNLLKNEIKKQDLLVSKFKETILQEAVKGELTKDWRNLNPNIEPASNLLKKILTSKGELIKLGKIKKEKPLPPISKEEEPFELPKNWVWCRLGSICHFITKGTTPAKNELLTSGDIPYLKVYNIVNQKINFSYRPQFISKTVHEKKLTRSKVLPNDVLMNIVGPPLGKVAIVPNDYKEWNINQALAIYRPIYTEINKFIYYYLYDGFPFKYAITKGVVGQDNLSLKQSREVLFPLAPLEEQKIIVEKLETLLLRHNELKSELEKSIKNSQKLIQAVLKEAFQTKETKIVALPILQDIEEKHFVKRKMLASYIINKSANDQKFGDTKFEKLLHLADYLILKRNLGQEYKQKAAGPYDNKFTVPFFNQTIKAGWFYKQRLGKMNRIVLGKNNIKSQSTYDFFTDDELQRIDKLISKFKNFDYKIPEIISTLYAVWNNRIIRKQDISDENLKQDFLNWDKGKAQYVYPKDRVAPAIKWMKENEFVPDGWGKIIEPPKSKNKKNL